MVSCYGADMSKDVVTVWWYERDNGALRCQSFPLNWPHKGSTYQHEVEVKYSRDAVRMVMVHPKIGGGSEALQDLRTEALAYEKSLKSSR